MKKYVLDTDICIYWLKGNKRIEKQILKVGLENIVITFITECELFYGVFKSQKINENLKVVKEFLRKIKTLHSREDTSLIYGRIKANLEKEGKIIDDADLLTGCITLQNNYTLVTNNTSHFARIKGLTIENWCKE